MPDVSAEELHHKMIYERRKNSSVYWKNKAKDFHAAAFVLSKAESNDEFNLLSRKEFGNYYNLSYALPCVFSFTCATSLELLIKACIVEKLFKDKLIEMFQALEKQTISEDEVIVELDKNFMTHDLNKLANRVNLTLNIKEKNFLLLLTHELYWSGKYPIPKNLKISKEYSTTFNKVMFKPKKIHPKLRARPFDKDMIINWENYKKIWMKIEKLYDQLTS